MITQAQYGAATMIGGAALSTGTLTLAGQTLGNAADRPPLAESVSDAALAAGIGTSAVALVAQLSVPTLKGPANAAARAFAGGAAVTGAVTGLGLVLSSAVAKATAGTD